MDNNPKTPRKPSEIQIYGRYDAELRGAVKFLKGSGIGVTVRNEQPTANKGKEKIGSSAANMELSSENVRNVSQHSIGQRQQLQREIIEHVESESAKGKEKSVPLQDVTNISKYTIAQRARREREKQNKATNGESLPQQPMKRVKLTTNLTVGQTTPVIICKHVNPENSTKGKENALPLGNDANLSKSIIAQRMRRAREKAAKALVVSVDPKTPGQVRNLNVRDKTPMTIGESSNARQLANIEGGLNTNGFLATLQPGFSRCNSPTMLDTESFVLSPRNLAEELLNASHPQPQPSPTVLSLIAEHEAASLSIPENNMELNPLPNEDNLPIQEDIFSDEEGHEVIYNVGPRVVRPQGSNDFGRMDVECPDCGALHWRREKLSSSSLLHPKFGACCKQGKVRIPMLQEPPLLLKSLFDGEHPLSKSFRENIRKYNSSNAFTSLGSTLPPRVLRGSGPLNFTMHGELRHRTGALRPQTGIAPVYAQLYIYDPASAVDYRHHRNPLLNRALFELIQMVLEQNHAFVHLYRRAFEILNESNSRGLNIPASLHYNTRKDRRRYNLPAVEEIAVVLPGDGTTYSGARDIVLHLKGDQGLQRINECHPAYLPLHYVLLFPRGEPGWAPNIAQWDTARNCWHKKENVSQMQFYSFRLFERLEEYSTILKAGMLFQEFLVDAWAATEQNRLRYCKYHQDDFRVELYKDLAELHDQGPNAKEIGQRYILPSSFTGGPRHMFENYQDSMAITRFHKHPDIFLTMTANPKWPEIQRELRAHETASDRPDLVARVFELKRKRLIEEIKKNRVFGTVVAHVYTIEFQKRGLPHMHALFFLDGPHKIRTVDQVDNIICAEFPDPIENPVLHEIVKGCMVHGPCGPRRVNATCTENKKCTKNFPKPYAETTSMDRDGYPIYRRRNTGQSYRVRGFDASNQDVVPYNPYLTEMFGCHINVDVCVGIRCVKYIHKYIYKGHDRTTMIIGRGDEIQQYLDARYVGPPEAGWRIFGYKLHEEFPTVVRLCLHLPGQHRVVFDSNESTDAIHDKAQAEVSKLMAFFDRCEADEAARAFTYLEFPQHYTWQNKMWQARLNNAQAIGRLYFASPNSGERFYLRLLLLNVKGPRSFIHLRTVDNVVHETFKSVCLALGLLEDDEEWVQCLREAATMKTGHQLRRLFSIILTQCAPTHPEQLWAEFSKDICDDLALKIIELHRIPNPTDAEVTDYGLHLLDQLLQESKKSLADFPPMPLPIKDWSVVIGNKLIWEHKQLEDDAKASNPQLNVDRLNDEQRDSFDAVTSSVFENKGNLFFLSGGAGTGKTFLYNTIASKCRSLGHIVISVASSGIASLLLVGGRTAHSTFCLPLDNLTETSICSFTKQSKHAELFKQAKLIIWDEVTMQHRHCVEAVDRTLQDIRNNNKPFGDMTVVFGGDFRQTLPVITKGLREQIVAASLTRSHLWNDIHHLTLRRNMRLNNSEPGNIEFARYLNEIGTNPRETIMLPTTIRKCSSLIELITSVYPNINLSGTASAAYLTERTILSARNDDVSKINTLALSLFPGEVITYLGQDKMCSDDGDPIMDNRYPTEFLNSLDPSGVPPFKLELKPGCPIMLLRNILIYR